MYGDENLIMYYLCGETCRECINSPYRPDRCEECTFAKAVDFLNKYNALRTQYRELIKGFGCFK